MLTDTHTHLYSDAFKEDRAQMIQRALDLGVKRFFIPAIDSEYIEGMYALEKQYPDNVFLMMGLHPTSVKENFEVELEIVENQFKARKFYAVGEIGIDLYWDNSTLEVQKQLLEDRFNWQKSIVCLLLFIVEMLLMRCLRY